MKYIYEINTSILAVILIPCIEAGIYHFMCMVIIAIICKFSKEKYKEFKEIIYVLPVLTFVFTIPMSIPVMSCYTALK